MSLLFNSQGYFCEGEAGQRWQFEMEFGKIILSEQELSLIKKSDISLTERGSSIDKFNEGFKIPIIKIEKAYSIKNRKIYVVIVETRDDHLFSITMADNQTFGKKKSLDLAEKINVAILKAQNM